MTVMAVCDSLVDVPGLDSVIHDITHRAELLQLCDVSGSTKSDGCVAFEAAVAKLRMCCAELKAAAGANCLPAELTEPAWQRACQLWNAAVEATTRGLCSSRPFAIQVSWMRHVGCELLFDLPQAALQEYQQLQLVRFCLKASESWVMVDMPEQSELLLAVATRLADATCSAALQGQQGSSSSSSSLPASKAEELCSLVYDVHLARYRTAAKLNQQDLARQALSHARRSAEDLAPTASSSSLMCYRLARALHEQAAVAMTEPQEQGAPAVMDALTAAYELLARAKDCRQEAQAQQQQLGQAAAGDDCAGDAIMRKLLQLESKVLLCLAFCQLNHCQDPSACLKCTDALRQMETDDGSHAAVALLAFQAFMAQGLLEQAEKEATGIAVHDAASRDACLAVLLALLDVPGGVQQLKPVLELVLGRFPSDPLILTAFTERALKAAATAAAAAAAATAVSSGADHPSTAQDGAGAAAAAAASHQQSCEQLQELVLEQLERAEQGRRALLDHPQLRYQLMDVLYSYGVGRFGAKDFEAAIRFFSASLEVCEDRIKGRVARVLAMCHMGHQQPGQAASYCKLADSYEPANVATSFIRFKLLLLQGSVHDVVAEINHMVQCSDFCNDMLWFVCREAITANAIPVAKAALLKLHSLLQQQNDRGSDSRQAAAAGPDSSSNGSAAAAMPECIVLRPLVKLLLDELEQQLKAGSGAAAPAEADTTGQAGPQGQQELHYAPAAAVVSELSEVLNKVAVRLKRLGVEGFTGEKEASGVQQVEWLSVCAWNAGLHAAGLSDFQGCAVLMNTSAQLLSVLPSLGPKQLKQQKMAYTLSASAGLEVHISMPEHAGSLRLAAKMAAASAAVSAKLAAGQPGSIESASEAYDLLLQFRIALHQRNSKDQVALIARMVAHPCVGADRLHQVVAMCSQEPHKCPEVAAAALEGTLHKLMRCPTPNYRQVAMVLRMMLQRAGSDAAKLKLYREACGILTTLPPNTYPARELRWLINTCWNCGVHHSRHDRQEEAAAYMQAALDMLPSGDCAAEYQEKKQMMAEQLQLAKAYCRYPTAAAAVML